MVRVLYDIDEEIESINGVQVITNNNHYVKRDIIIVDSERKTDFLLKNAFYISHSSTYGLHESKTTTTFKAFEYFECSSFDDLANLKLNPKVKRIRIYSKLLNNLIKNKSLSITSLDDSYTIKLSKITEPEVIKVGLGNVRSVFLNDNWEMTNTLNGSMTTIEFNNYVEIELQKRTNYDTIRKYINEFCMYMQLYAPNQFVIEKIAVEVDGVFYILHTSHWKIIKEKKYSSKSVETDLVSFLSNCYLKIDLSKPEYHNISNIVFNTNRNLEDLFLIYYRFIECFYKRRGNPNTFISSSLKEHYKNQLDEEQQEKYSQEIVSLRNAYVHSGYYLKNNTLRVKYPAINRKANPKNYTVTGIDPDWLFQRIRILRDIVLDIIFNDILGYEDYKYEAF